MDKNTGNGEHPEKDALVIESDRKIDTSADTSADMSNDLSAADQPMDRAAALAVLGLSETANAYAVDNRFWQLTKRYRAEKNDEKLKEVTDAYEVASGRAAARKVEQIAEDRSKKIFGKSTRQWKVFFYYSWWKIIAVLVCAVLAGSLAYQMITGGNYDIKIVSIGHFSMDNTFMSKYTTDKLGYKNPYITYANLVIDGSEAESNATVYGAASAASFLSANPDVIIFDSKTMPYYLGVINNLDSYYEALQQSLPQVLLDKIKPVRCTMKQYIELTTEEGETPVYSSDDEIEHIYGLEITDPELIKALGYINEWASEKDSLVFCISTSSEDTAKAENFITAILKSQNSIVEEYNTENGTGAAATDSAAAAVSAS